MPNGNGTSGLWRVIAVALISVVVTGAVAWLGFAKDAPDRREVTTMIERGACQEPEVRRIVVTASPYVQDRAVIRKSIDDLEATVDALDITVDGMRTEQTRLIERIDRVLAQPPR